MKALVPSDTPGSLDVLRNTLIVHLSVVTGNSVVTLQSLSTEKLISLGKLHR